MITLRPHHLLCTYAYRGNGYSSAYIANFDRYLAQLQQPNAEIMLKCANDCFCTACPHAVTPTTCTSELKVQAIDLAVLTTFDLNVLTVYKYADLIQTLKTQMNAEKFTACCQTCEWYTYNICQPIWCE